MATRDLNEAGSGSARFCADSSDLELPLTIYNTEGVLRHPGRLVLSIVSEIARNRSLVLILFLRDLRAQFRQSLLGYAWLIFPPLATAFAWHLLNEQRIVTAKTSVPYPEFVFVGTAIWTAFTATVMAPTDTIYENREVLVKLNVCVEAFILAGVARAAFNLFVTSGFVVLSLLVRGVEFGPTALLFPLAASAVLVQAFAAGMLIAPIGALYNDVRYGLVPLFGLLMFAAPVVFPIPDGTGTLGTIVRNSPLTPGIALCRDVLLTGSLQWAMPTICWFVVSLLTLLVAFLGLRVSKPHIIARMGM